MKLVQQYEVAGANRSRVGRTIAGALLVAFVSVATVQAQDPTTPLPGLDGPTIPGLTPGLTPDLGPIILT